MSDEAPEESHVFWKPGYVGANIEAFPPKLGDVPLVELQQSEKCSNSGCYTPTIVSYAGMSICLSHALKTDSFLAGRTDEKLGPPPPPNRIPPWEDRE